MRKHKRYFAVLALAIICLLASCYSSRPEQSGRPVVRVGYLRLLSGTPLYTALREGYFEAEGLDVQMRVIKSGPEGNEALAAGNIDVAFSILPPLLVANERGVPPDLVSIYGASIDGPQVRDHRLIIPKGSNISRVEDLRGKKIAVVGWPGMTSDGLELLDYLERHNIKVSDVTLVGMGHGDMLTNLQSGVIAAAAAAEPYITIGTLAGTVKVLDEDEGFYYQGITEVTTYLARRGWIDANRDVAQRFVRALERGRQKGNDREWLVNNGLPSFNNRAKPPIDFVELTPEQASQLRLMPINPMPSEQGVRHVAEQLIKRGTIKAAPQSVNSLLLPLHSGQ